MNCKHCDSTLEGKRKGAIFCSRKCKERERLQLKRFVKQKTKINSLIEEASKVQLKEKELELYKMIYGK